jgi:branched-chain amino acid transport system substrate-binding protein
MSKRRANEMNRRKFLKKTAVTAGALGASSLIPGFHVNAAEPIRIGVTADMTGALADFGYWISKSAKAATQRVNASGGIAGREVRLIVEDTESKPPTGVRKTRKLIQRDKADFIIGSHHSGIGLAVAPIFKELKTIGFPSGNATPITGKKGNPYMFRLNESVLHEVWSTAEWAVKTMGKRWTLMGADMAWGQDQVRQWDKRIKFYGGEVVDKILIPLGTDNWVPYLSRIDQERTQVIFHSFFNVHTPAFLRQANELGILNKFKYFGTYDSAEGFDPAPFEGAIFHTPFPQRLSQVPKALRTYDAAFRKAINVDEEGKDLDRNRPTGHAHNYIGWENVYLLKEAVEKTGYKNRRRHTKDVIRFLQGYEFKPSMKYPTGRKIIRAEDHQTFMPLYIQQVKNGKYEVIDVVPLEGGMYPPQVNLKI